MHVRADPGPVESAPAVVLPLNARINSLTTFSLLQSKAWLAPSFLTRSKFFGEQVVRTS